MAEKEKKAKAPAAPRKTAAKKKVATIEPTAPTEIRPQPVNNHHQEPRSVSHHDIAQLAHRYWSERGHPHGNPEEDWYRAEQELRGKAS